MTKLSGHFCQGQQVQSQRLYFLQWCVVWQIWRREESAADGPSGAGLSGPWSSKAGSFLNPPSCPSPRPALVLPFQLGWSVSAALLRVSHHFPVL